MESFYIGLSGALTGGIMLSLSVYIIWLYEKKQTAKLADKLTNDLRNIYAERTMSTKTSIKTPGKFN